MTELSIDTVYYSNVEIRYEQCQLKLSTDCELMLAGNRSILNINPSIIFIVAFGIYEITSTMAIIDQILILLIIYI